MKLLANENFPLESVYFLKSKNIDIISIQENFAGMTDIEVLKKTQKEGRIILTFDKDYGELIYKSKVKFTAGIVFFRLIPKSALSSGKLIYRIIKKIRLEKRFTIISSKQIRQRILKK